MVSTDIHIPELALVVLVGPSGSGKSTFAKKHFLPTEILSSDACRALVSDDENDQSATPDAFEVLHTLAATRLRRGRLTVIDATNVQPEARKPLVDLVRKYHSLPVAIVLNISEKVCQARNRERDNRTFGPHVVRQQRSQLRRSIKRLRKEGFRHVFVLDTPEEVDAVTITRERLWNNKRDERGPFDIIGDVHGCYEELEKLLEKLGYARTEIPSDDVGWGTLAYAHPQGRRAVFVGDLCDRGPRSLDTVRLVRNMMVAGSAFCVPGNHDIKLLRHLSGRKVQTTHGFAETLAELEALPDAERSPFCDNLRRFLDGLISHYVFDDGKIVVAHAGLREEMQGRGSGKVREFALYGETTGETDEFGLPVRHNWAQEYRGEATVVYGHTPVPEPDWLNRTLNIDTGCVFGGSLTALRYPERELVSVQAMRTYAGPIRPFLSQEEQAERSNQQILDDVLDAEDVLGKRIISTTLRGNVTIREENATAALEVMSRFAANPKWLVYLPPTMSPTETSTEPGLLEHPREAFCYYRNEGIPRVICEEKHMGSRAVVVVCRDRESARSRFGIVEEEAGIVYTRTGRRFFKDADLETCFFERVRNVLTASGFWTKFETTWACLDCELMPWSAKARELLQTQYAAVGASGRASLTEAVALLERTSERLTGNDTIGNVLASYRQKSESIAKFVDAYRQYCWSVTSLTDLKLAPFHLLATEGRTHTDKDHLWHMQTLADICEQDTEVLLATEYKLVDLSDADSEAAAVAWWTEQTERGGEGMVVKPMEFITKGRKGLTQPAVKCRGREYLRIIYGPEYTTEENLARLRSRGVGRKRSLALREFALGVESLRRFVQREPLRRVHECVFGVLALESEPIDPRL